MNQSQKMLLLQFSEVEELISKTRGDSYSDNNKASYHENLIKLFDGIKTIDLSSLDDEGLQEIKSYIHFIFNCLIFLRDSTLNSITFEIVKCLNNAMEDWVDSKDYIIVTGLTKNLYDFSFFIDYSRNDLFYQSLKIKFGVDFKQKLVQINLPITLCKDYISTVPLYHELGHFIEKQYNVAFYALSSIVKNNLIAEEDVKVYFPVTYTKVVLEGNKFTRQHEEMFYNHLMEYFCDLFAAQYVGLTSNLYLNSISSNDSGAFSHPSNSLRERMVRDFLNGKGNLVIDMFNSILQQTIGRKLIRRHVSLSSNDFYNLIPFEANSDAELHGIFEYGWSTWLGDFKGFEPMLGDVRQIPGGKIYSIINSLMEKSIGNYFIRKTWNEKSNGRNSN